MNLIEKLGGYDRASKIANCKSGVVHPTKPLLDALLEYRRQHNIFEVGDWFVSDAILKPYKIIKKNGDYLKLWCKENTAEFSGNAETLSQIFKNAKHATDAEIKAGHRIIHPTDNLSHLTDHCTDIRNHISPNTIVLDSDVINFDLYIPMRSK